MLIGLNATCFNDRPSGAKQRFVELYGALIRRRADLDFVIYEPLDCRMAEWFPGATNIRFVRTPLHSEKRWQRSLRGLAYWRGQLRRDRLDLFETFHLPLVLAPDCPTLLTIHDARPARADQPAFKRRLGRAVIERALRLANRVITVSATMRAELLTFHPAAAVDTIYNGIDPARLAADRRATMAITRRARSLPDTYLLAVGHIEPRKNYARLIDAMASLGHDHDDLELVIVGNDSGLSEALARQSAALGLSGRITFLHGVSDEELADIYAACTMLVFASLYEGFGIPILEAMAARKPLVLSDIAVFRELTEDQAIYCDPRSSEAIAAAIATALAAPGRQQAMVDYGVRRIDDFGFDPLSRQVEAVHAELIGDRR